MKKQIFLIVVFVLLQYSTKAQVIYSENFDGLNLGNVGTDLTGQTPGQGGLYTYADPIYFQNGIVIINEPNKGKVLQTFSSTDVQNNGCNVNKRDLDVVFNQRTVGNDILKVQFDFYTGDHIPIPSNNSLNAQFNEFQILSKKLHTLGGFRFYGDTKKLFGLVPSSYSGGRHENFLGSTYNQHLVLPANQWVTIAVTIDFLNGAIYFEIPHLGIVHKYNSLRFKFTDPQTTDEPDTNGTPYIFRIVNSHIKKDNNPSQTVYFKYDNINITAVNQTPTPTVGITDVLSSSFTLFPNPANNIINITNNDHHLVQSIKIYDTTGKFLKSKSYKNEKELQLNIESLQSGMYYLHIITDKGVFVKEIIKN